MFLLIYSLITKVTDLGDIGDPNTKGGLGAFSNAFGYGPGDPGNKLASLVSRIVGVITIAAGIWFLIQLLLAAFKWINSGGDKANIEQARDHLTSAVISLGILVAAYVLAGLFGIIFGLDILNPQTIIPKLGP
ncbi:hypothetical protein HY030_02485 [Candidatus Gottesmanbacteria bacterium]|nr:hypothetical protein [Candidatus Gottesmanbacteria bacterium]